MQGGGAVGVEHAFRAAGGAGGVAQDVGGGFVEGLPRHVLIGGGEESFVVLQGLAGGEGDVRHVLGGAEDDHRFDEMGDMGGEFFDERGHVRLGEQDFIAGMVDDVGDVLDREAGVDGVGDRAEAADGVVELDMAEGVPGQGGDTVARFDAETGQDAHELAGADFGLRVGLAVHIQRRGEAGEDFGGAVLAGGVAEDGGGEQRFVLHQPGHGVGHVGSRFLRIRT